MNDVTDDSAASMLDGLVVLDFTRVLAGPQCTRLLADLGARIIKIERPGEGDEMRRAPAPLPGDGDQSTYFARRNAGKESVAVDLAHPQGRQVILDIARHADVVVENFMPGIVSKLGVDYEAVKAVKPDIVYCSISGYGQTGPLSRRGAFAHVIAAASGIMYLDADEHGPRNSHLQAADVLAGTNAFGGILAALWRRERTGRGAHIDVSMLESLMASEDLSFGTVPNGVPAVPGPRSGMGITQMGDRWLAWQTGGSPNLWPRLCTVMDQPDLINDARFATGVKRRDNWSEIQAIVSTWLNTFPNVESALSALNEARLPSAAVLSVDEVVASEHLEFRGTFHTVPHDGGGTVKVTSSPYWIDGAPVPPRGKAPYQIGEHTRPVLSGLLGYSEKEIESLLGDGAVAAPG